MIDKDNQNRNHPDGNQNSSNNNTDSDYGLPEAEYSPIEREQPLILDENVSFDPSHTEETEPPKGRSNWILWVALVLILSLAGVFVYFLVFDEEVVEAPIAEVPVQEAPVIVEEEIVPIEQPSDDEWETAEPEVQEGSVSTVTSRTGEYYLIVGSFIDGDLARDYGQKLTKEGISSKIIEPSGTQKFYRLSVSDAATFADLSTELDSMKARFGENIWIVKY